MGSEAAKAGSGHRLYVKGKHLSYQRGKRNTNPGTSLIKIEGVDDPKAASFYLGKRIAYVYRGKREIRGTKIRVVWGKVTRSHGNSGVVRAQFRHNLPPKSFGAMVRIMLYPSSI
ncbi:60S ribosomal protein L33B [Oleoguttula mirabilis]|uniref:60S ribosomal protein L33B n=1 Tax=Oleoguttula mirabilis TaxID=1507867 RepID=A0AAV9JS76_9PEZI|nr:60S ribosomal protein L33B [Oleoguttula mirabilis]